jgi:hypothetical protein
MIDSNNSVTSLHKDLIRVESEISILCKRQGIPLDTLEQYLGRFDYYELDLILGLLYQKLALQEEIYKAQGGDLSNVVFLEKYRR